jgi:lipopolysaccharide export system permease protein
LLLGVLTYAVYANALVMSRSLIEREVLPPLVGLWWVHLLIVGLAVIWLRRQGRVAKRSS